MEQPTKVSRSFALLGISFTLEFFKSFLLVIVLALIFRIFIIQPFIVVGQSMEPNFHDKNYLLIDKLTYKFREPRRGEVIIFHPKPNPSESYIKRIVGLPGETVEVKAGKVYIDDKELEEGYTQSDSKAPLDRNYAKTQLASGEYFVFGDNRDHSSDSREIGSVPRVNIQGRVAIILLPFRDISFPFIPKYAF